MKSVTLDQITPGWWLIRLKKGAEETIEITYWASYRVEMQIEIAGAKEGHDLSRIVKYYDFLAPIPSLEVCRAIYDKQKED